MGAGVGTEVGHPISTGRSGFASVGVSVGACVGASVGVDVGMAEGGVLTVGDVVGWSKTSPPATQRWSE